MTGAVLQRELPMGLEDLCFTLGKMTGSSWKVDSLRPCADMQGAEPVEAVQIGVGGMPSPRFLLAVPGADANGFAATINGSAAVIPEVDVPAVMQEAANILVSAILNGIARRGGEALIVTAPKSVSGRRAEVFAAFRGNGAPAMHAHLSAPKGLRLELAVAWTD